MPWLYVTGHCISFGTSADHRLPYEQMLGIVALLAISKPLADVTREGTDRISLEASLPVALYRHVLAAHVPAVPDCLRNAFLETRHVLVWLH